MAKKCKENEIYFAPQNKCIPNLHKSDNTKENVTFGIGAVVLGGLAGWLLGRNSSVDTKRHPHDAHERNLILEYNMTDFIPLIDLIDFHDLEKEDIKEINDGITIGVVKRLKEIEDQNDFDSLYFDLQETQDFVEKEADQEDAYDMVAPIINHFQNINQIMDHFETVDEMIEYLDGNWE